MNLQFTQKRKMWLVLIVIGLSGIGLSSRALLTVAEPNTDPTVTVLTPSGAATDVVGEGDDYFTQVLHEPRTMDRHTDLIWQSFGINNISFANGIWSGTTTETGGHSEIYPLYPGFSSGGNTVAELGKTGWNYPVQTSKYKQISFRIKAPNDAGVGSNPWWQVTYSNISFTLEVDHYNGVYQNLTGWQVYSANLASKSTWTNNPAIYGIGFRFGLTTGNYQFDWIRLVDPTTSPVYPIKFSVAGTQAGDLVDLECYTTSQAGVDSFCGSIKTGIPVDRPGTYQYDWRTAYLPPGQYYVKATARRSGAASSTDMSTGSLSIASTALLAFDSPSMTSGPDYATEVLGNPWDMNDSSDIFTSSDDYRPPHDFAPSTPQCPCFANGEMYGTVGRYDPHDPADTGDPFVYLRVGIKQEKAIDTTKYKYVTYRYKVDRPSWWPNSGDRLAPDPARNNVYPAGWLVRLIFFHSWFLDLAHSNTSNDIVIFDDWNTYQMDLSQGVARGYWEPQVVQPGGYWTGTKTAFRFDFLEGVDPWVFHLDDVKLTGDDVANASYEVKWSTLTSDEPKTIDFYASTNQNTCLTSGELIYQWSAGSQPPPPLGSYRIYLPLILGSTTSSSTSFAWNTAGVAPGTYYLCAKVDDGYNTSTSVSNAAVIIAH